METEQTIQDRHTTLPLTRYLPRIGKSKTHHSGKIQNLAALGYGGQARRADELAHNDHINGAVQNLQRVGGHKW